MAEPIPVPPPAQLVTVSALLIPLFRVCGLVVTLGVVFAVDALTRAFFGTVSGGIGWIPFLGQVIESPIHKIEAKVSSFLGGLETHIDASMGGYFHALADAVGRLADGEAESAWVDWTLGKALHLARAAVNTLPHHGTVTSQVRTVVKQVRTVIHTVYVTGKIAAHAAPGIVTRQVGALTGELDHVIEWDIPRLWRRTRSIENQLARLYRLARAHAVTLTTDAAVAAVAVALARLGGGWIRCRNWSKIGRAVCGLPSALIDDLLLTSVTALAVTDVCDFADAAYTVAQELQPLLFGLVDVENGLVGCHGASAPPALGIGALSLPPVTAPLPLAA